MPYGTYDFSYLDEVMNESNWNYHGLKFIITCSETLRSTIGIGNYPHEIKAIRSICGNLLRNTNYECIPLYSRSLKCNKDTQPTVLTILGEDLFRKASVLFDDLYMIKPFNKRNVRGSVVLLIYEKPSMFSEVASFDLDFAINTIKDSVVGYFKDHNNVDPNVYKMINTVWPSDDGWHWITNSELSKLNAAKKYRVSCKTSGTSRTNMPVRGTDLKTRIDNWFKVGYNLAKEVSDFTKLDLANDTSIRLKDLAKLIEKETDLSWERTRRDKFINP